MITGKRGKPSVSEKLIERLILAHNPGDVAPRVFSDLDGRFGLVEAMDIASKCKAIAEKVAKAAESVIAEAGSASTPAEAVRAGYPWLSDMSPVNVILEAERAATVNDQAVSALMAHLANHLIIGEGLKQIAAQAQREIVREVDDIPKEFRDFCNQLQVEGVTVTPIARMSKARLKQVAALIRGLTGDADEDPHVNPNTVSDGPLSAQSIASMGDRGSEVAELQPEDLHENSGISADRAERIVDPASDAMAARAAEFNYQVFERLAVIPADIAALDGPKPPEDVEFRMLGAEPRHRVDLRMMSEAGDLAGVEEILMKRWAKDRQSYADDAALAKRWSWQLVAMSETCDPAVCPPGWWDGVILKSAGTSADHVRELRAKP